MTNWELATKDNLKKLVITDSAPKMAESLRLSAQGRANLNKTHSDNTALLRKKLCDYTLTLANKYVPNAALNIGLRCNMSESIVRKVINGNAFISREFLGKFCVGLKLSKENSEELFMLSGPPLDFNNSYFDAITMTAIVDRDSIDDYEEDLKAYLK